VTAGRGGVRPPLDLGRRPACGLPQLRDEPRARRRQRAAGRVRLAPL